MNNIKILDCTLRDGGYVNNWCFGYENIKHLINGLNNAKIDFIECGYLRDTIYNPHKTIFSKKKQLQEIINTLNIKRPYCLMINYGEYPLEKIEKCSDKNLFLRIAFKQNQLDEAMDYCQKLQKKGYKIFIHPMHTGAYSEAQLLDLVEKVNKINPYGLTIVDTTGSLKEKDVSQLYKLLNENLNSQVVLAFHTHNNLNLSFANAKRLASLCQKRSLVIDTTLKGMGRGAGNLETEKFIEIFKNKYDKGILQNLIGKIISPICQEISSDGVEAYRISAENFCHPNYATYLLNKNVSSEFMEKIFKEILLSQKLYYNEDIIEKLLSKIISIK